MRSTTATKLPANHQELFQLLIDQRIHLICETSPDITEEVKALRFWTEAYALNNGLNLPNVDWEIYIQDED